MKKNHVFLVLAIFITLLIHNPLSVAQTEWVDINGTVTYNDTPVCAMVLANGQNMFSCGANLGVFDLEVPLDANGEITLYCFVSGLAPFKRILEPADLVDYAINMAAAGNVPEFSLSYTVTAASRDGWVDLSGSIDKDGTPICALVLGNGQHMFSCGENLGVFSLEAPIDQNNRITLYTFAAGHRPYKQTLLSGGEGNMTITSSSYQDNAAIPSKYACTNLGGQNTSPQLGWVDLPMEATSLAIIMDDEDSPCGTDDGACIHWNVFNIPISVLRLNENHDVSTIDGVTEGRTYAGTIGYAGPCPPWTHNYRLAVYALSDSMPLISEGVSYTRSQFETEFAAFILDSAVITGSYTPPN